MNLDFLLRLTNYVNICRNKSILLQLNGNFNDISHH